MSGWCSPLESASGTTQAAAGAGCSTLDALSSGGALPSDSHGIGFPRRRRSSLPGATPASDVRYGSPGVGVRPRLHPVVAAGAFTAALAAASVGRFVLASILLVAAVAEAAFRDASKGSGTVFPPSTEPPADASLNAAGASQ